jgi:DNA-binding MarR family transcriptional regulator
MGTRDQVDGFVERAVGIFPRLDPEVEGIVDRIHHLEKRFGQLLEHTVAPFGLNKGEFKLLMTLRQRPPGFALSPGALGECLLLSSGAMTNRLDRLEEAGLVVREADPDDRRALVVRLTPSGLAKIDDAVNAEIDREVAIVSVLTPAEQKRLNALMRKMILTFESAPRARVAAAGA